MDRVALSNGARKARDPFLASSVPALAREVLSFVPEVCAWCARNRLFPSYVSKNFAQGISSLLIFIVG